MCWEIAIPGAISAVESLLVGQQEGQATESTARIGAETGRYATDVGLLSQREQRVLESAIENSRQRFSGSESAAERRASSERQKAEQMFQAGESAAERAARERLQGTAAEGREFQAGESAVEREAAMARQQAGQTFQAGESEKTREFEKSLIEPKQKAYEEMLQRGIESERAGEEQFLQETGALSPELTAYQEAIRRRATPEQERALAQSRLELSRQGVTGGQAATLQGRASGDLQQRLAQDVTEMAYEDALRRREARAGFFGTKAARGQASKLTAPTFASTYR
jgi:hypothetical protein